MLKSMIKGRVKEGGVMDLKKEIDKIIKECKLHPCTAGCKWYLREWYLCWWGARPCCRGWYPINWLSKGVDLEEVGRILMLIDMGLLKVK